MKKIVPAILVLALIIGGVILLTKSSDSKDSSMNSMDMSTKSATNADDSSAVATDKVSIEGFNFSPATIKIKKGTTVTWTNQDSVAHNVHETDGKSGPMSDSLKKGDTYTFTYSETGTFKYICSIHPDMKGTVIVTD